MVEKQEKCNYPKIPLSPDRTRSKGYFKSTWSRTRVSEMTICRQPDDYKEVRDSRDNPCLSPNRSSIHPQAASDLFLAEANGDIDAYILIM
jgi:hypothetical protein